MKTHSTNLIHSENHLPDPILSSLLQDSWGPKLCISCFGKTNHGEAALLWLVRQERLITTQAVRHLAIATFGNNRWRQNLLLLRLDSVYLDIYLFYVYGRHSEVSVTKMSLISYLLKADSNRQATASITCTLNDWVTKPVRNLHLHQTCQFARMERCLWTWEALCLHGLATRAARLLHIFLQPHTSSYRSKQKVKCVRLLIGL